ncbi:putative membrane protein [Micrococcus luteus]|nr:putative membrane protein [Micrococcus luteus]
MQGLALATAAGSLVALPVGVATAGAALLSPVVLGVGLAVALLSTAVPYGIDLQVLRRMPTALFSLLTCLSPIAAALTAWAEHPDPGEREGRPRRRPPRRPRRHGQRQRPEHLERHGHALRDPCERLVDGQVHAGHGRAQPDDGGPPPGAQAGEGGAARPGDEQQHGRGEHHAQGDHGGRADVVEQQARHGRAELLAQQREQDEQDETHAHSLGVVGHEVLATGYGLR